MRTRLLLAVLVLCTPARQSAAQPPASDGWEPVSNSDGVQTYRRPSGAGQLRFQGRIAVAASLWQTMAVLMDEERAPEWAYHCLEARVLRQVDDLHLITYRRNTAGAPFVADRDMVLDLEVRPAPDHHRVSLIFTRRADDAAWPVPDGVVRVPAIAGSFRCDTIDEEHTQVVYEVAVNTGGALPAWVVNRATADLPRRTLLGLKQEVLDPRYAPAAAQLRARLH